MPGYHTLVDSLADATPPYLRGRWGSLWITALGGVLNDLRDRAKYSVKARFILDCPSDAVAPLGRERRIDRAPGDTDDVYRSRVDAAWATWRWSGTDEGVYQGLASVGLTVATWVSQDWGAWPTNWPVDSNVWIVSARQWGTPPGGDDDPEHFARFWVVVNAYAEGWVLDTDLWSDPGNYDDGGVWDLVTPDAAVFDALRQTIRKWKHSGRTCPAILAIASGGGWADIWGPLGCWDDSDEGVWGGDVRELTVGEWA